MSDIIIKKYGEKKDLYRITGVTIPGDDVKAMFRRVLSEAESCVRFVKCHDFGPKQPPAFKKAIIGVSPGTSVRPRTTATPIVLFVHRLMPRDDVEKLVERLAEVFAA